MADCVMAMGFEKMQRGSLSLSVSVTANCMIILCARAFRFQYTDRTSPMDKHMEVMFGKFELSKAPVFAQMFGNAGVEHMKKYGRIRKLVWQFIINSQLLLS
jgi:sterol carrier protein 2